MRKNRSSKKFNRVFPERSLAPKVSKFEWLCKSVKFLSDVIRVFEFVQKIFENIPS